jgi:hypothetical protein
MDFIYAIERKRKRLLSDKSAIELGGETVELSGSSFLETLAYLSQTACIREYFGEGLCLAAQKRLRTLFGKQLPYTWLIHLSAALELRGSVPSGTRIDTYATYADGLVPLVFASLCGRTWLKDGPKDYESLPVGRFWAIFRHLRSTGKSLVGCSVDEAFQAVECATDELWSESLTASLVESLTWEEGQLNIFESRLTSDVHEIPLRVWRDYLRLRRLAVERFQRAPLSFLDPVRFAPDLLSHLDPFAMVVVEKPR